MCASSYSTFRNPDKILILQPEELQIVSDFPTRFEYAHFGLTYPSNSMMESLKIKKNPECRKLKTFYAWRRYISRAPSLHLVSHPLWRLSKKYVPHTADPDEPTPNICTSAVLVVVLLKVYLILAIHLNVNPATIWLLSCIVFTLVFLFEYLY